VVDLALLIVIVVVRSLAERTGLKLVLRKDKNESSWSVAAPTTNAAAPTVASASAKSKEKEKHKDKDKDKDKEKEKHKDKHKQHKHKHHKHKEKEKVEVQKEKDDDKIPPIRIPKITIKTSDMVINRELTTPLITMKSAPALSTLPVKERKTRRNSLEETAKPSVVEKKKRRKSDTSSDASTSTTSSSRDGAITKKLRIDSEDAGVKPSSTKEARKKKDSPRKTTKPKESSEGTS